MLKYLIDVNLPRRFALWSGDEFVHIADIDDKMLDSQIWEYAKDNALTIVTKDADFSELVLLNNPPPRVIHIKFGNMKINDFYQFMNKSWLDICQVSENFKLVNVFVDKIEGID